MLPCFSVASLELNLRRAGLGLEFTTDRLGLTPFARVGRGLILIARVGRGLTPFARVGGVSGWIRWGEATAATDASLGVAEASVVVSGIISVEDSTASSTASVVRRERLGAKGR